MTEPMNKHFIKFSILIIGIVFVTLAYFAYRGYTDHPDTSSKVTFIKTLKKPDGTILGDLTVVNLHSAPPEPLSGRDLNDVFTTLYVTKKLEGKDVVLYKINDEGFFNTLGKEQGIEEDGFYGYQFADVFDDHFVVHLLGNNGKDISDDATIVWDSEENVFEILRPHEGDLEEDPPVLVGTLKASDNSTLGAVYVTYLNKNQEVLNLLYIIRMSSVGAKSIYVIKEDGFSSSPDKKDLEIAKNDFHGFKLSLVKDDYLIVYLLDSNGNRNSEDITIKWNYEKNIFEIVQTS